MECQEPHCSQPAARNWGGRKVCADHYEQYEEEQRRQMEELREY